MHSPTATTAAARYFDATSTTYDDDFSETSIWAIAHHAGRAILEEALAGRTDLAIADIGCGTGKWAGYVADRAARLLLSDVSEAMLELASAKFTRVPQVRTLAASVDDLRGVPDASCDLVLCMGDPLSYVSDYVKGVAEVSRIAKPGGLVFVSVDSRLGYLRILKERHGCDLDTLLRFLETGNIVGWEGLPLHAFTVAELESLFSRNGCQALSIRSLPTASAHFLFEERFRRQIQDPDAFRRLLEAEQSLRGEPSPGPHHLYGLFRKGSGS